MKHDIMQLKQKRLILLIALLFFMSLLIIEKLLIKDFGEYDRNLCKQWSEIPSSRKSQCPQKAIVTVLQNGRLGNQMWEYAAVWAVAKRTGHDPYVPSCIITELEKVFENLTIPPLSDIAHCKVEKYLKTLPSDTWEHTQENILLPTYAQLPEYVIPLLDEVLQLFKFKHNLQEEGQRILHSVSGGGSHNVYIGVHVRRGDYTKVLPSLWNMEAVEPDYFFRAIKYFKKKFNRVIFIVLSDDPVWCREKLQTGHDDIIVVDTSNPGLDLAIMAACNHSILDYGTFGMWGAAMAGGETLLYNLTWGLEVTISQMLPNWHAIR